MSLKRGNTKKVCEKCGESYGGFGNVCGQCRKMQLKARGSALACSQCGEYFLGFGSVCPDCKKTGTGEVDFERFKKPGRSVDRDFKVGDIVETLCKGGMRWVATVIKVNRDGSLQLSGGMTRTPDQVNPISTVGASVYTGLSVRIKGSDDDQLNGEEGVCESWDEKNKKMLVRLKTGEVKQLDMGNLDLLAPEDDRSSNKKAIMDDRGSKKAIMDDSQPAEPTAIDAGGYLAALQNQLGNLALQDSGGLTAIEDARVKIDASPDGQPAATDLASDSDSDYEGDEEEVDDGKRFTVIAPAVGKPVRCTEAEAANEFNKRKTMMQARGPMTNGSDRDIEVTIIGATGLRDADWGPFGGKSDPYVVCSIANKPHTKFKTRVIKNELNPEWQHMAKFISMDREDTVLFRIFDKDFGKKDDFLGQCTVQPVLMLQFYASGFEGEVPLWEAGKGVAATLRIRVKQA